MMPAPTMAETASEASSMAEKEAILGVNAVRFLGL